MGPSGEACINCYFFALGYNPQENETKLECATRTEEIEEYGGFCNRFPPAREGAGACIETPVYHDQWCGEFKSLPAESTQ